MGRYLIWFLCTTWFLIGAAQAQDSNGFEGDKHSLAYLKYLFHEEKHIGIPYDYLKGPYKNRIAPHLVEKFLPHNPVQKPKKGYYAGEILINNQLLALAYDRPCYEGDLCRTRYLTILDQEGNLKAHTIFGYDSSTALTLDTMRGRMLQQELIEKVATYVQFKRNSSGRKELDKVEKTYDYQTLLDNGELKTIADQQNRPNREYPWSAKRLIQPAELDDFSTRELQIFKNEIFADYGFRFPEDRWQQYFNKKSWYHPTSKDVSDSLNRLEAYNIKRIIRHQRNDE